MKMNIRIWSSKWTYISAFWDKAVDGSHRWGCLSHGEKEFELWEEARIMLDDIRYFEEIDKEKNGEGK